jgi:hypothetical protein
MIDNFDAMKKQLVELAGVINAFKSEAVQVRIIELILESGPAAVGNDESERETKRSRPRRKPPPAKAAKTRKAARPRKAPTGQGPVAAVSQLAEGTFFDKPRTIKDILDHCVQNLARRFKANEISGKLARMARNDELTRKKNADNQYEYSKP